jgi:hypothetical protein
MLLNRFLLIVSLLFPLYVFAADAGPKGPQAQPNVTTQHIRFANELVPRLHEQHRHLNAAHANSLVQTWRWAQVYFPLVPIMSRLQSMFSKDSRRCFK